MIDLLVAGIISSSNKLEQTQIKEPITIEIQVPPEPTVEEKILSNYYKCDTNTSYIRADNAECLAKPVAKPKSIPKARLAKVSRSSPANTYAAGNCTWYVKDRRPDIPNGWGNANRWYGNAAAQGWSVGSTPRVGAVAASIAGMHVALVIGVSGSTITISEMNYQGLYKVSSRSVSASLFRYIY